MNNVNIENANPFDLNSENLKWWSESKPKKQIVITMYAMKIREIEYLIKFGGVCSIVLLTSIFCITALFEKYTTC